MKNKQIKISEEADQAVEKMLQTVNDGYLGGRVSRADLISWVLIEFKKKHLAGSIEVIRKQSFDQLRYLESIVKLLKESRKTGKDLPQFEIPTGLDRLVKESKAGNSLPSE